VDQADKLGLGENVIFHGFLRGERIGLLQGADICVFPSRYEPFGIVLLEAMAAGKALIASSTGGIPEVIRDGQTGLLCSPTPDGLAEQILKLADRKKFRKRLGKNATAQAGKYDWANIAGRYLSLYEMALPR
jgi:glycosyltransferase involved in cell wall biosynthesis